MHGLVGCVSSPNLTWSMVSPARRDTTDPCFSGVLLGGAIDVHSHYFRLFHYFHLQLSKFHIQGKQSEKGLRKNGGVADYRLPSI
jgi:hypothetical protein